MAGGGCFVCVIGTYLYFIGTNDEGLFFVKEVSMYFNKTYKLEQLELQIYIENSNFYIIYG